MNLLLTFTVGSAVSPSNSSQLAVLHRLAFSLVLTLSLGFPHSFAGIIAILFFSHIPKAAATQETKVQGGFMSLKAII